MDTIARISEILPQSLSCQWEQLLDETLRNTRKLSVCFVGAFSTGKTSLINMLLNKENLLPVALKETTTLPTFIEYGPALTRSLTYSDGSVEMVDRERFNKMIISGGDPGTYATLAAPEPWLRSLQLIDLPGTGSTEKNKTDYTRAQLRAADVVLYLIPPKGPDQEDMRLLKMIHALGKQLLILVSQWDVAEDAFNNRNEPLPDLQEWERVIEDQTGFHVQLVKSSINGMGRNDILAFLGKVGETIHTIREARFQKESQVIFAQAFTLFEEEKRFLEFEAENQKLAIRTEIREKRELLLKNRKELHQQQIRSKDTLQEAAEKEKSFALENFRHDLEKLKTDLLQTPNPEGWDAFISDCNLFAEAAITKASFQLQQLYEQYGELPEIQSSFSPLSFKLPPFPTIPLSDLMHESRLTFLVSQIEKLSEEMERDSMGLVKTGLDQKKMMIHQQIRHINEEKQTIENAVVPVVEQYIEGTSTGKFLGRILGEIADIGLLFVDPHVVGVKIASYAGKASKAIKIPLKTQKVAKAVTVGVKSAQTVRRCMQTTGEEIDKIPTRYPEEKANFLEKLCLGYWGEKIGSFFDEPPQALLTSDPSFLEQRNALCKEKEDKLKILHAEAVRIQAEVDRQELTQYQIKARQREIERLKNEEAELKSQLAMQKEAKAKEEKKRIEDQVRTAAEKAIRGFIYTLDKNIFTLLKILDAVFKNYWENEIRQALEDHEERLKELERKMESDPEERRRGIQEINDKIAVLKSLDMATCQ